MENAGGSRRGRRRPGLELRARAAPHALSDIPLFEHLDDSRSAAADASPAPRPGRPAFEPGRWATIARAVGLAPETEVIVALSGGADSVYLLEILAAARPRPRLVAVHVEHGLRGAAGLEDARFCERLCRALDVPFVLRHLALDPHAPSLEARAREGRYRVLCEEAARLSIGTLLTGHHADDALETLLQRWLRGTDLHGLAGLRTRLRLPAGSAPENRAVPAEEASVADAPDPRRSAPLAEAGAAPRRAARKSSLRPANERLNPTDVDVEVVRPLIAMRREEVRSILRERRLEWREDGTNESPRFTRNRLRNLFLPEIERVCGPSAIENLRAFGRAVESLEERCAELTAEIAWDPPLFAAACRGRDEAALGGTIARERLTELSPTLRRRALWRLIAEGTGHAPGRSLLESLMEDLARGRCGRHSLSAQWSLQLRSHLVHLEPPPRTGANTALRAHPAAPGPANPAVVPASQLDFPFASADRADAARHDASAGGARLDVPGLVVLDDGRCLSAEIVELSPTSDIPRSQTCVELDAHDLAGPVHVRWPRAGDRFQALGAPGSKSLGRFFGDIGLPRRDRARVPLVFAAGELIWVAGIRPCESRRVRHTTQKRLRLTLYPAPGDSPAGSLTATRGAQRVVASGSARRLHRSGRDSDGPTQDARTKRRSG